MSQGFVFEIPASGWINVVQQQA